MVVISDLYEIKLSSDKSNLNYNEPATITVQAIDFNGANITGKKIMLTVDKGYFIDRNASIGKSYTGTTTSNGFTISYKATEYGIINFNCTIIETLTGLNDILDGAMYEGGSKATSQIIIGFDQAIDWTGVTVTGATLNTNPNTNCVYGAYCYQLVNAADRVLFKKEGCYPLLLDAQTGNLHELTQLSYNKSSNLQLFANNLKKINITTTHGNSPRPLYVDELRRRCYFSYYYPTGSLSGTKGVNNAVEGAIIPSAYRPLTNIRAVAYRPDITWILQTDGKIYYRIESTPLSLGAEDWIRFDWYY